MSADAALLPWDSNFFGRRIGRVTRPTLDAAASAAITAWATAEQVECLYFLCSAADTTSIRQAEQDGYHFVDIRLTLTAPAALAPLATGLRHSQPHDLPALEAIARAAHVDTRFYADPHFDPARSADLYALWIANDHAASLSEPANHAVWVGTDAADQAIGYLTCRHNPDGSGQIGLLGVSAAAQGQGLGGALVTQARSWCAEQGITTIYVVTQGRNVRAQRTYQRAGFVTRTVQLWYHRWS